MSRLLTADFNKLKKNRFFWLCMAGMFLFGVVMAVTHHIAMIQQGDIPHLTNILFFYTLAAAILIPAFVSLFIGTEYSDGTIRNKLVIGHTRNHIYLSNLIVCSAAGMLVCATYIAAALLVGIPLSGIDTGSLQSIMILFLISMIMSAAFTALCTLTALLCQNKAMTAVINILIVCFCIVMSIYIYNKLEQPETIPHTSFTSEGEIIVSGQIPNPDYLKGTEREVYQFLNDFLPTGQAVNIAQGGGIAQSPEILTAYSAGIVFVSTAVGIFAFRKRDIK